MRKLIVSNIVSLDGCVAGPGGNVMALPMDGFFDEYNLERQRTADTLLLGANSYRGFKGYWPQVAEDPTNSPAVAADPSVAGLHREIGERNNTMRKVVISDSLTQDDTAPWTDMTTIVPRDQAIEAVRELKQESGTDILTFGSRIMWNSMLVAGLVDELHLMIGSVIVGDGTPAFPQDPVPPFRLIDQRRREDSNNILLRYEVLTPSGG